MLRSRLLHKSVALWNTAGVSIRDYTNDSYSKSNGDRSDTKQKMNMPVGKLDDEFEKIVLKKHPYAEKEPLPPWPDNVNPHTGEKGGPKGPEPTRYGDWERKGRVSDF
ncbi:hypothetical protein CHUAL_009038 [Chamberlinius hualienensis]